MTRTYIVECYWPGVTERALADAGARVRAAVETLQAAGRDVRYLGSLLVPADEVAYCRFAGTSETDVAEVSSRASLRVDRVVEYLELPEPEPTTGRKERP